MQSKYHTPYKTAHKQNNPTNKQGLYRLCTAHLPLHVVGKRHWQKILQEGAALHANKLTPSHSKTTLRQ